MKIVILGGNSKSTFYLYNKLRKKYSIEKIIIEKGISKIDFLNTRIKRFGYLKVFDQILFKIFISNLLNFFSSSRINEIIREFELDDSPISNQKILFVDSVNSQLCRDNLIKLYPDLVLVNGTGIISEKTLNCISTLFINSHVGITPEYRGVHGAYWALVNNDFENCGVTVHKVDKGIDTGDIIYQETIKISINDNFATYPYIQNGIGIKLIEKSIDDFNRNKINFFEKKNVESKLFTHPTFSEYIYNLIIKKVK
jgi:folate-dependent phosphoribosylglycinamide formyltransferase PurN